MSVKIDYEKKRVTILSDDARSGVDVWVQPYGYDDSEYLFICRDLAIRLYKEEITELLPILQKYVDTGKVVEDEYRVGTAPGGFTVFDSEGEQACEVCFSCSNSADKVCDALNRVSKGRRRE